MTVKLKFVSRLSLCVVLLAMLFGCSGGGGGGGGSSSSGSTGSSSNSNSSGSQQSQVVNQIPITVDAGPAAVRTIDIPFVSVTICAPGTSVCQTIDHVLVDTGASGLRIMASVLNSSMLAALPAVTSSGGDAVGECMQFVDGYTWGPVKAADIKFGGEVASGASVQIIGSSGFSSAPTACKSTGPDLNTVQSFGGNGALGLSVFAQDCGQYCTANANNGLYYTCSGGTCSGSTLALDKQVWNPVALLPTDNNGTAIYFPAVSPDGAETATGTLTFGIGTQDDNAVGNATVLKLDSVYGELTAMIGQQTYPSSFFDTGSNGFFYGYSLFSNCNYLIGFYCPSSDQSQAAVLQGLDGQTASADFIVGNPETLLNSNPNIAVYSKLAGPSSLNGIDFGLPFYLGRTVFTAIKGMPTPSGTGPWVGVTSN